MMITILPQAHAIGCPCSWRASWGSRRSSCSPSRGALGSSLGCSSPRPGRRRSLPGGFPWKWRGFKFFRKTFSRTRKARTPVRVATPILNKPPSSPDSITCTDVDFICCQKRGSNREKVSLTCWYVSGRRWRKTSPSKPPTVKGIPYNRRKE